MADLPRPDDPRMAAAAALIGRTGAVNLQIRYDDDPPPTVWVADAEWDNPPVQGRECAAALDPLTAVMRLCERVIDGGTCVHCRRPSGVDLHWERDQPLERLVCWYVYDPELQKFRRSCEGDAKMGRNDPCWCGSGQKFKRCHGTGGRPRG